MAILLNAYRCTFRGVTKEIYAANKRIAQIHASGEWTLHRSLDIEVELIEGASAINPLRALKKKPRWGGAKGLCGEARSGVKEQINFTSELCAKK